MKKSVVFGLLLSFLFATILSAFSILVVIRFTLLNDRFMIYEISKTEYAQGIKKEITRKIQNEGLGSNIPENLIENIIPLSFVETNITNYTASIYNAIPFQMNNLEEMDSRLQNAIESYANDNQIELNPEAQQSISRFKQQSIEIIQKYIELPYLSAFGQKAKGFRSTIDLLIVMTGAFLIFIIILFFFVRFKAKHIRIRRFAYGVMTSGLLLIVFPIYIYFSNLIERIAINSEAMYRFVVDYVKTFIFVFILLGAIYCISGILLWLISEKERRKIVKK